MDEQRQMTVLLNSLDNFANSNTYMLIWIWAPFGYCKTFKSTCPCCM